MHTARFSPVVHLELHTGELARARDFYAALCGWPARLIDTEHGSYLGVELGHGLDGGMVECTSERALWLPYVQVQDIVRASERARELGAAIPLGPREGPAGWRSVVRTRWGGELALWQQKR